MSKLIIFAAPSGSGKTSIVKEIMRLNPKLKFSVSATTRKIRDNEVNGRDYHFISIEDFKHKIEKDEFIEYQEVYTNQFYGTLKYELEKIWSQGDTVLFDVDVVGGVNLKKIFGERALSVFVKPPSLEVLKERLVNRNTESQESLNVRLTKAESELTYESNYDYILINDDFNSAVSEINQRIINFI
jgi:guanylate kinase